MRDRVVTRRMSMFGFLLFFGLLLGLTLLYDALVLEGDANQMPCSLPWPGKGHRVLSMFNLPEGGNFYVKATIPWNSEASPPSQLPCDIAIAVLDSQRAALCNVTLKSFRRQTLSSSSGMVEFSGPSVTVPRRGFYNFEITGGEQPDIVNKAGAIIAFVRTGRTLDAALGADVTIILGYSLVISSFIGLLSVWIITTLRSRRANVVR